MRFFLSFILMLSFSGPAYGQGEDLSDVAKRMLDALKRMNEPANCESCAKPDAQKTIDDLMQDYKRGKLTLNEKEVELARAINQHRKANGLPEIPLSSSMCLAAKVHVRDLHRENNPWVQELKVAEARLSSGEEKLCKATSMDRVRAGYYAPPRGHAYLHSWSGGDGKSAWSGCAYPWDSPRNTRHCPPTEFTERRDKVPAPPTFEQAKCMWDKPRELTGGRYRGNGYEIGNFSLGSAEAIMENWRGSPAHYSVMMESTDAWRVWTPEEAKKADNKILEEAAKKGLKPSFPFRKLHPWKSMCVAVHGSYSVAWFGYEEDPAGPPRFPDASQP